MFVLKYKEGLEKMLFDHEERKYNPKIIGGYYVRFVPSSKGPHTKNLAKAKVFNTKQEASRDWHYPDCDLIEVSINIKEVK